MDNGTEESQLPIVLRNLFTPSSNLEDELKDLSWQPFREGVEIAHLYGSQNEGPSAALLRYAPGAGISRHEHKGYEHVLVLSEHQRDERGTYPAGTLVINTPGSSHAISNEHGGIVLVIRTKPVQFPTK